MAILKRLKAFAPMLAAVLVAACVGGSLYGYQMPDYTAEVTAQAAQTDEQESDAGDEEEIAVGSFDLEDGIYYGTGTGYAGAIKVAVTVKDKTITAIDVVEVEADDSAFFNRAKGVIDKILQSQSLEVDVVSGATYSSNGIINAVKNALTGEVDDGKTAASASSGGKGSTSIETVEDAGAYKDGTYTGSGTGFEGTISVQVTISGGKIADISILSSVDDEPYFSNAKTLISKIISSQSTNVDTVSGATYSSVGIITAVRNALAKAAVSSDGSAAADQTGEGGASESSSNQTAAAGTIPYNDGIYYGTGEGYAGDLTVAVVIQDKTIKAVLITETEDDDAFLSRAKKVAENIVATQSTQVDTVSGATYSSRGIIEAVQEALKAAEAATNGSTDSGDNGNNGNNGNNGGTDSGNNGGNNGNNGGNADSGNHDGNKGNDGGSESAEEGTVYKNGTYTVTVKCDPDETEGFESYNLTMSVTLKGDRITAITDVTGDGGSGNDSYIKKAVNGTKKYKSVISQILALETAADELSTKSVAELLNVGTETGKTFDTVSTATCTTRSILEGSREALKQAKEALQNANAAQQ